MLSTCTMWISAKPPQSIKTARMGQSQRKNRSNRIGISAARRSGAGPSSTSLVEERPFFLRAPVWVCLGLIAANLIIYFSVRHFEFVTWDDPQYVIQNP